MITLCKLYLAICTYFLLESLHNINVVTLQYYKSLGRVICHRFFYMTNRSNLICDNKNLLFGLSDGSLYNISWKGEVIHMFFCKNLIWNQVDAFLQVEFLLCIRIAPSMVSCWGILKHLSCLLAYMVFYVLIQNLVSRMMYCSERYYLSNC